MTNEIYNNLVVIIQEHIIKFLNSQEKMSWREFKQTQYNLTFEYFNLLIEKIRRSIDAPWSAEKRDTYLNEEDIYLFINDVENLITNAELIEIDLSVLHQLIIADDISYKESGHYFTIDKHKRDTLGAYFTPQWLADELTIKTVNNYLRLNYNVNLDSCTDKEYLYSILSNLKVADLSVGGGAFLKAYIRLVKNKLTINKQQVDKLLSGMYGIDIDPIALMICKHDLSLYSEDCSTFVNLILGNPLINEINSFEDRTKCFEEGRIYNQATGVKIGKYDIILGNPPWEKVRFEERSFFRLKYPKISSLTTKAERQKEIIKIQNSNPTDYDYYLDIKNDYNNAKKLFKENPLLNLSLSGELNAYSLFYELAYSSLNKNGVVGLLVKSSMIKTPSNKRLFNHLVSEKSLVEIDILKNRKKIFKIDSREEFSFVIASKHTSETFIVNSGLEGKEDFLKTNYSVEINGELLDKINPNTHMIPNISSSNELEFLKRMYSNNELFEYIFPDAQFGRLVHFTNHSEHISKKPEKGIPIYEGKFIERYDSMFATFEGMSDKEKYKPKARANLQNKEKKQPISRYFLKESFWEKISSNYNNVYTVMWRSLTSITNKRTTLATVMPFIPTSQSIQFLQISDKKETIIVLSLFNSIIFDFIVRLKMPGIDLTQTVIKSIPVPNLDKFDKKIIFKEKDATYYEHISARIAWLYRNDESNDSLFKNEPYYYHALDEKTVNAEIDILIGKLYGLTNTEIKMIARQFPSYYSEEELELYF